VILFFSRIYTGLNEAASLQGCNSFRLVNTVISVSTSRHDILFQKT
jgi:hypothetical protein